MLRTFAKSVLHAALSEPQKIERLNYLKLVSPSGEMRGTLRDLQTRWKNLFWTLIMHYGRAGEINGP